MDSQYREPATMLLAGRKYIYKLLQKLWIAPPKEEQIKALHDPSLEILLELMSPSEELNLYEIFHPLKEGQLSFIQDEKCFLTILEEEYHAMTEGDLKHQFCLYGVQYLSLKGDALEDELLALEATYHRYGAFSGDSLLSNSHISMEFGFMAHTSGLAQQAIEVGNDERASLLLEEQEWFLKDHLMNWIPQWHQTMQNCSHHFYQNLAEFTVAFLKADHYGIDSLLEYL